MHSALRIPVSLQCVITTRSLTFQRFYVSLLMCISLCVLTLHLSPVYLIVHVFIRNGHFEGHGFSVSFRVICTPHFCVPTIRNYHEITYLSKVSFLLSCAFLCVSSHCTTCHHQHMCLYVFMVLCFLLCILHGAFLCLYNT